MCFLWLVIIYLNSMNCQVAVYAEFRRDWAEALRFYEDAYHTLREVCLLCSSKLITNFLLSFLFGLLALFVYFLCSRLLLHFCWVFDTLFSISLPIMKKKKRILMQVHNLVLTIDGHFSVFSQVLGALLGPSIMDNILILGHGFLPEIWI